MQRNENTFLKLLIYTTNSIAITGPNLSTGAELLGEINQLFVVFLLTVQEDKKRVAILETIK